MIKKYLRAFALVPAVAALVAVSLTGCSSSDAAAPASDCKPAHADLKTITPGSFTVGVIDIPPFSSYHSGSPEGIDVNIVKKFAKQECLKPVWQQATYADAIQSISGGTIDVAIGTIDRTAKREQAVSFSSSTYLDGMGIASRTGAKTVSDLEKMGSIGTINGYLWDPDLQKILGNKLKLYPSSVQLAADFDAGRLDASVDAYGVLVPEYKGKKDITVSLATETPDPRVQSTVEPPQAAFPLSKDNTSLKSSLSASIDQMRKDGDIKQWLQDAGLSQALAGTEKQLAKQYTVQ